MGVQKGALKKKRLASNEVLLFHYWVDSEGSKIGVCFILGYKYLDGSLEINGETILVEKNSLEIGLRINW